MITTNDKADQNSTSSYSDSSSDFEGVEDNVIFTSEGAVGVQRGRFGQRRLVDQKLVRIRKENSAKSALQFEVTETLEADAMVIRVSEDRSLCAVGMANGDIRFFHLQRRYSLPVVMRLKAANETLPCTDLKIFTIDRKTLVLATYASGYVRMWDYAALPNKGKLISEWKEEAIEGFPSAPVKEKYNQILCLAISCEYERFVTGGTDSYIRVYQRESKKPPRVLQPTIYSHQSNGHTNRITAVVYHPRARWESSYEHLFVSASWDDSIQIWDDRVDGSLWQYYGPHVSGNDGLDIDPLHNVILTCSWRRDKSLLQLWKFASHAAFRGKGKGDHEDTFYKQPLTEFVYEPKTQSSQGYVAKFDPSFQFVIFGGSNENMLAVIDMSSKTVVAETKELDNGIYSAVVYMDEEVKSWLRIIFTNARSITIGRVHTTGAAVLQTEK
ncbi:unnamed protein product [Calicophoron daubneyi]|uniref:Uncharacterized protein n=1 Tax=Calicophoron daubneyi TaxID=300641 RepID=A0AAV2TQG0_CALDB